MRPDPPFTPTIPLRLRWRALGDSDLRTVHAYDGPWQIGFISDHRRTVSNPDARYLWGVSILSTFEFPGALEGRCPSARQAAENVERAFFQYMPQARSTVGRIETVLDYYAFLGGPLPPGVEHRRRCEVDGENLLPFWPNRIHIRRWGDEERRLGRRGLVTPSMMRETYGDDWREQLR